MSDFRWLRNLPDEFWTVDGGGGQSLRLPLADFLTRSGAQAETYGQEFDAWASKEGQGYQVLSAPALEGPGIIVTRPRPPIAD